MAEKGKNMLLIEPGNPRLLKKPVNDGSEYSLYLEYKVGYKEENGSCIRRKEGLSLRLLFSPLGHPRFQVILSMRSHSVCCSLFIPKITLCGKLDLGDT